MEFSQAFSPIRSLGGAWRAVRSAPGPMVVGGLLMVLLGGGGGGGGVSTRVGRANLSNSRFDFPELAMVIVIVLLALMLTAGLWLFTCLVRVGFASATERVLKTGDASAGEVFEARGLWTKMLLTTLLRAALFLGATFPMFLGVLIVTIIVNSEGHPAGGIAIVAGVIGGLLYLPILLYVFLGLALMPEACAIEGMGASDALRRSWGLASGHRLILLAYYVVLVLFTLLGLLACCVGVLFTGALVYVANYESYLRLVRSEEEQAGWLIQPI